MRFLGEIDKFLLRELPMQRLLALKDVPPENFGKELSNLVSSIGMELGMRLLKSEHYVLPLIELTETESLTELEVVEAWRDITFLSAVQELWKQSKEDTAFTLLLEQTLEKEIALCSRYEKVCAKSSLFMKKAKRQQLQRILNELSAQSCQETLYLYGIIVYAKTLFLIKGLNADKFSFK